MPAPAAAAAAIAKKKALRKLLSLVPILMFVIVGIPVAALMTLGNVLPDGCAPKTEFSEVAAGFTGAAAAVNTRVSTANPEPDPVDLEKFMWAKRQLESNQNYDQLNKFATASGAYQYIDSTWNSRKRIWGTYDARSKFKDPVAADGWLRRFGTTYGNWPRAYLAPPEVQDAVARDDFISAYRTYGNWMQVSMTHYYPIWVNDPTKWDTVPRPDAGNKLTLRQYGEKILAMMDKAPDSPPGFEPLGPDCSPSSYAYLGDGSAGARAVAASVKYIGIGYKFAGGRSPETRRLGMDCSGFTRAAYLDIGINIGLSTHYQVNDGISIGLDLANAKPGDLIITGRSRSDTTHVQMYYKYENGQHLVIESAGAGANCTADAPVYNANSKCKGIGPPHPWRADKPIVDIRRIVCGFDSSGNVAPCQAAA